MQISYVLKKERKASLLFEEETLVSIYREQNVLFISIGRLLLPVSGF